MRALAPRLFANLPRLYNAPHSTSGAKSPCILNVYGSSSALLSRDVNGRIDEIPALAICEEEAIFPASHSSMALCQGTTSVGPLSVNNDEGFSPCAFCQFAALYNAPTPPQGLKARILSM